jgi:hypothetical protein
VCTIAVLDEGLGHEQRAPGHHDARSADDVAAHGFTYDRADAAEPRRARVFESTVEGRWTSLPDG